MVKTYPICHDKIFYKDPNNKTGYLTIPPYTKNLRNMGYEHKNNMYYCPKSHGAYAYHNYPSTVRYNHYDSHYTQNEMDKCPNCSGFKQKAYLFDGYDVQGVNHEDQYAPSGYLTYAKF